MQNYQALLQRVIIDTLIGDKPTAKGQLMPYLKGYQIEDIAKRFGVRNYINNPKPSRWEMFKGIMKVMMNEGRLMMLFDFLFSKEQFKNLPYTYRNIDEFNKIYSDLVEATIQSINIYLSYSSQTLAITNGKCHLVDDNSELLIETVTVQKVSRQYIKDFPKRIEFDIINKDYDSVVNKSRTLLEEIFCYIIEQQGETPISNGRIESLLKQCQDVLGIQTSNYDQRILQLISGLTTTIKAISALRNICSDAHGVGEKRINISQREAILIANASETIGEYYLSVYLSHL